MSRRSGALAELEAAIGARMTMARLGRPAICLADRFELRALIGTGAFGLVARAWDRRIGREVAIKCIPTPDPTAALSTFGLEAQALGKVTAPEIVQIFDCLPAVIEVGGVRNPCLVLVMEYVSGLTLRRWLMAQRTPDERLAVMLSAARGLEAAHEKGVVHRDFKPENVMVTCERTARLVDFGLAYRAQSQTASAQLVRRGTFGLGTVEYMAPEAFDGEVSVASDQFSLAVTIWEALTGARPFEQRTKPRDPSVALARSEQLSSELCAVLGRAMQPSPDTRFASVATLRAAIESSSQGYGRFAAFIAGAAALGAVATTAYLAGKGSRDQED